MQVFTRDPMELVKGVFYSLGGGLIGFIVAAVAEWPLPALIGLPVAFTLAVGWLLVAGESIRVEVHDDGRLDFYRLNKLKHSFDLKNCTVRVSSRANKATVLSLRDMSIYFADAETGKAVRLDFAPLGKAGFARLRECLRQYTTA